MTPSPPRFSDHIEEQHVRIDPEEWDDIYVVGDVHGCRRELDTLLDDLDPAPTDLVVFVGDLVRKGPDSKGVLDRVRGAPNMYSVLGNNEAKLLRGELVEPDLAEDDLAYLGALPIAVSWDRALVVHGGVDPRKPLAEHTVEDLLTMRSLRPGGSYDRPFWFERYRGPHRVFFGHTVLEAPVVREHAVGLDTGCVYGGELTAYDWRRDDLVSVDLGRTVKRRKASKFVAPRANGIAPGTTSENASGTTGSAESAGSPGSSGST